MIDRTVDDVLRDEIELAQGQYARSIEVDTLRKARAEILALRAERDALRAALQPILMEIAAERQRQQSIEGWTIEHDDAHTKGDLALAAGCYAIGSVIDVKDDARFTIYWPWDRRWWKHKSPRRNLVRAGALIVAEIERLDRNAVIARAREAES